MPRYRRPPSVSAVKRRSNSARTWRRSIWAACCAALAAAVDGIDDPAADAVRNDFRHGPVGPSDHRRSSRHGFDHDEPERLRPVDRKQKRTRIAEKFAFLGFADFADEFDEGMVKKRFDLGLEIRNIDGVHLCRDFQGGYRLAWRFLSRGPGAFRARYVRGKPNSCRHPG